MQRPRRCVHVWATCSCIYGSIPRTRWFTVSDKRFTVSDWMVHYQRLDGSLSATRGSLTATRGSLSATGWFTVSDWMVRCQRLDGSLSATGCSLSATGWFTVIDKMITGFESSEGSLTTSTLHSQAVLAHALYNKLHTIQNTDALYCFVLFVAIVWN
jgi:hypothetical protein